MPNAALANRLIDAATAAERKKLASGVTDRQAAVLADEIRRICIADWSSDPARVQRAAAVLRYLAKMHLDEAVCGNSSWVTGIAEITRGRFQQAIDALDAAISSFAGLGREVDMARVQVSKLLALAMLSHYDEAIATGLAAIPVLEKHGEDLAAGKIEMNLSNIVSRRGLHREAEGYCASARSRFIKAGESEWQAMAENGLANTYAELNDFERADQYYETARATAMAAGMLVTEAEIEASMGNLDLFRGRYADALRHLELSRRKFETLDMPHQTAIADLEIADIYAELNLNAEACEIYERVCDAFRRLKLRAEEARARLNYGRAAHATGLARVATRQLRRSLQLYAAERNLSGQASAMLEQARVEIESGEYGRALAMANDVVALLEDTQNTRLTLTAGLLVGEAFRRLGNTKAAREAFENVRADSLTLRQPDAQQRALTSLGTIDAAAGDVRSAEVNFNHAIRLVEQLRAPLASEEFGMAFLAARLAPYESLSRLYLDSNRIADAFRTIESGRSRSLADAVSGDAAAVGDGNETSVELARIREELNSYYKRLDRAEDDETDAIRAAISERESSIAVLTRRIGSLAVSNGQSRKALSSKHLMEQLGGGTLVEFIEIGGMFSAFVIAGGSIRFVRDLTSRTVVEHLLEDLHFQFGTLRYGVAGLERFMPELTARTNICLQSLYDALLRPIAEMLAGEKLVIVPAGPLHYVPFHALHDGERYLAERFETTYAPSAGVWSTLQERPRRKIENSLLMAFADERIPLVEAEAESIRKLVPSPRRLTGTDATFAAFASEAPKSDLIHLACHGQFRTENPMFSSLHLADGWVTVRDICSQRIEAELVTLSACETGLNKVHAGDEILGLARGFLTAGASSLIVSLWTVSDAAASQLMFDLYSEMQRGTSAAASLRQAQIRAIRRAEHPFMWSPFVLIGR